MNPMELELALKKQRLQMTSASLRNDFARHAGGLELPLSFIDKLREGWHWLHRHPQVLVGVAVAVLVARPRGAWRTIRRSFFAWQAWSKLNRLIHRDRAA